MATGPSQTYLRPAGLVYAVDEWPPPVRLILLGLQFAVLSAIYLVLVAIVLKRAHLSEADRVSFMGIACVGVAIGTLLQALPRGPVGSGFLAPPVFSATYLAPSVMAAEVGGMPLVCGMTLFAGLLETLIALALNRLRFVLTPVLSGLAIFVVGLELGTVGIRDALDVPHELLRAFPVHLAVSGLTLALCVSLSIWGRGVLKLISSLLGLVVGLGAAAWVGLINPSELLAVSNAGWMDVPWPPLLRRSFDPGLAPAFIAAAAAASLRAVGVVTTCQRINNAAWQRPDMENIRKGVLADGLANVVGGLIGATGMSTGPSLVGISNATGATSRAIAYASSAIVLAIGCSPKLAGFFLLVPTEVAGSVLVLTSCFMITGGMEIMLSRPADTRTIYIIGIATLLALSESLFPHYFRELPPAIQTVTASALSLGLTAALGMTLLFRLFSKPRVASAEWAGEPEAIAAAAALVRSRGTEWKLELRVTESAATDTEEVLRYIADTHAGRAAGVVRVLHDGTELRVEIRYAGLAPGQLPERGEPSASAAEELENEEAAAHIGLRRFIQSLTADRKQVRHRRGRVVVRLFYAM